MIIFIMTLPYLYAQKTVPMKYQFFEVIRLCAQNRVPINDQFLS